MRIQAELDDFLQVYAEQKNPRKLNLGQSLRNGPTRNWRGGRWSRWITNHHPLWKPKNSRALLCSRTLLSLFEDEAETIIRKPMLYWITHRVLVVMVGEQDAACLATQQMKCPNRTFPSF